MAQVILPVIPRVPSVSLTPDATAIVKHLCHELRQPLSTIESAAYYLQMVGQRGSDQAEQIQQMVQQANRMLSDAVYLLQAAPPRPQWVDLTELIQSAINAMCSDQPSEVDWSETAMSPLVWMDPGQAGHLVRSLIGALSSFSQTTDDSLMISLYREGDEAVLEVAAHVTEQICRLAGRLFEPLNPAIPSGALALASVQRIVEAHSGTVTARHDNDHVLTVEVRLPSAAQ